MVDESSNLRIAELASLAGLSAMIILIKIKQINSNDDEVKYVSKKLKSMPSTKITNEFLIDLVNSNSSLNMK